ncbi:hypothetical protein [uncultured Rothia sp.]|uniref:hypothetical protein n=1 Tax=uncultured Rothia sp. TaxID=316088 RepID=UPI00288A96E6|nr:hypothetical protein [uncultured Rothia sp.]
MSTMYGLGFEPFPLLLEYELNDHLMLRTDSTPDALFLGSHMNGEISEIGERLAEYEEAGHTDEDLYAEEERLWRELCSRLIGGESGCCEAMSRFYDSLIIDYSTDETAREWLQGKGLHLPVVPISDEPDSNESALPDFASGLSEDYLEQLHDLFWMYPGFTEDGKPCVWVCPGRWRMMQVVLMAKGLSNPALFLMRAWDWDSESFQEMFPEVSAEARENWIIDGYLDRAEIHYNFTRTEIEYRLPEETREELERELNRFKVYGGGVKLARRVRVLDYSAEYNGMVCKVGIDIG